MRLLFVCWLLGWASASAQQYSLRNYKAQDGLPQSQVSAMVEDKNGYLWLGTMGGGLARFDGREFKVYTTFNGLLNNNINSLMIDSDQNLWITHPRGISRFDGMKFKTFQEPKDNQRFVGRMYEIGDSIFFQMGRQAIGKIFKDSVITWETQIAPTRVIYFGLHTTVNREVCFYLNDSSFLLLSQSGKRRTVKFKNYFSQVFSMINYQGNLLLKTDKGYFLFDYRKEKIFQEPTISQDNIVAYDSINKVFWLRREGSITKLSSNHKTETILSNVEGTQVLFDREGNTWIATSGSGIYKYYISDFEKWMPGVVGSIMAIEKDNSNAMWLGSMRLIRVKNGTIKEYPLNANQKGDVTAIKKNARGEIWVATLSGLGHYDSLKDKFTWYTREDGLSSQYITALDFDEHDNLWCGTWDGGINYFDGKKFKTYSVSEGLGSRYVASLKYSAKLKTLFVGSEQVMSYVKDKKISTLNLPELVNTSVISMNLYKEKYLLMGSSGSGILIFDPVSHLTKIISSDDGLPSNLIYFVAPDEDGFIWVGTEQGISRMKLNDQFEIAESHNYGYDNGLTGVETNSNSYYLGNEKYFGLIDGVYKFNDNQKQTNYSYPLHLTGIEIFYEKDWGDKYSKSRYSFFKIPFHPVLPSNKNHITFYFNRVNKQNPKSVRYQYFLEKFDKAWSRPSLVNHVTYGNLPPGEYSFQVKATNQQGGWDAPLMYSFSVKAPFYETLEFRVFAFVFITLSAVIIFYMRIRTRVRRTLEYERIRQQEHEKLRKEIARDFHDEMGNQLTRIINYISLMKLSQNGHANEYYNKVESAAKYLYTGTRDFIWSIDPINDELTKLFFHIRDFGEKLFEEKGINFRAYNELKQKVKLPYGFSREANLILKEAMTNAFNHSNAKNVSFSLKETNEGLEMQLADDGEGFEMSEVEQLNGLNNMRVRATKIKSKFVIHSHKGSGTEVRLILPELKTKKV
jgi:signal transduction histidine kinase/ligand-binding sensor domain-containing protein